MIVQSKSIVNNCNRRMTSFLRSRRQNLSTTDLVPMKSNSAPNSPAINQNKTYDDLKSQITELQQGLLLQSQVIQVLHHNFQKSIYPPPLSNTITSKQECTKRDIYTQSISCQWILEHPNEPVCIPIANIWNKPYQVSIEEYNYTTITSSSNKNNHVPLSKLVQLGCEHESDEKLNVYIDVYHQPWSPQLLHPVSYDNEKGWVIEGDKTRTNSNRFTSLKKLCSLSSLDFLQLQSLITSEDPHSIWLQIYIKDEQSLRKFIPLNLSYEPSRRLISPLYYNVNCSMNSIEILLSNKQLMFASTNQIVIRVFTYS